MPSKTKSRKNPTFLLLLLLIIGQGCASPSDPSLPSSPNIIVMIADDLGYADLGCYNGLSATPNLDKLAEAGIRFTDFYAAAPNCSPSRAGLLTGRSPSRIGVYNYIPAGHPMHLRAEEVTIAEVVKEKGYRTGQFGKWHLSSLPPYEALGQPQPDDQGFDYSLGTTNNAQPSHLNPINFVRNGQEVGEMKGYSCDIVVDETITWLEQDTENEQPFFCYMAFHEPHKRVASPPELTAKYSEYDPKVAEYLANIENLDAAIGRLIDYLTTADLLEETLILFSSDNGSYRNGSNTPLLGGKSFVYEGGIRVPGILYWKNQIAPNQTIRTPVGLIDIMPTISELTGSPHPKPDQLDGISLVPIIKGKPLDRQKPLSWFFYRTSPEIALRSGNYVILGSSQDSTVHTHRTTAPDMPHIKSLQLTSFELYDLSQDISQEEALSWEGMDIGQQLQQQLVDRLREIQAEAPIWDSLPPATTAKRMKHQWRKLRPTGFSN
ncbi:MAG: sulfatase-like hydrolase/transferase [Saprospiraceae bacterium]|nr:sulfatase-like hydrolase/transferase [Saprospiraceae bacterium]